MSTLRIETPAGELLEIFLCTYFEDIHACHMLDVIPTTSTEANAHRGQGVGKKIIKHIMPNFVFKPWPGGLTDHGNHRVMASFPGPREVNNLQAAFSGSGNIKVICPSNTLATEQPKRKEPAQFIGRGPVQTVDVSVVQLMYCGICGIIVICAPIPFK
ncbi:hypothetical protein B0H14DRAFT_2645422 [Mycena olivaceomarginata]|nr:hypothetical protein B0H14DRAFT_2645422 [Mycena olivaceomarginata]